MFDVAIIGGGPAGSAAARLLASWGHSVALVHKPTDAPTLAESLPPSTRKLLDAFGITGSIDGAAFWPWRGNTVWWGRERRVEPFPDGTAGHHVVRAHFDRLLRSLAAGAGATQIEGTVSEAVVDEAADAVRLRLAASASSPDLLVRFVLDCSGRAGVLARSRHLRVLDAAPRTIALAGVWTRAGAWDAVVDPTHTVVETYDDGWVWSVPVGANRRYVTVMIDPRTTDLNRGAGAEQVYRHELAKPGQFAAMLDEAALEGGPWGFDASLYTSSSFCGPYFLLVGDAGSSLDPVSSFGVKKALASAWLAAVVAHTWLQRPAMRDAALEFFDRRERDVYASYRHAARQFSVAASSAHAHPFWIDRGAMLEEDETADLAVRLREDPEVLRAFARIREAPALNLRRSGRARIERRPGIAGREIVLQECLVTDRAPDGLRYLRGVEVPHLLDLAPQHADAGELFDAYNRSRAPVALPDFLGTLAVLVAWGALEGN